MRDDQDRQRARPLELAPDMKCVVSRPVNVLYILYTHTNIYFIRYNGPTFLPNIMFKRACTDREGSARQNDFSLKIIIITIINQNSGPIVVSFIPRTEKAINYGKITGLDSGQFSIYIRHTRWIFFPSLSLSFVNRFRGGFRRARH